MTMTDEELDRARAAEAHRLLNEELGGAEKEPTYSRLGVIAAMLARTGWTPPDPLEAEVLQLMGRRVFTTSDPYELDDQIKGALRLALERGIAIGREQGR